jgi:hypothetical protein
MCCVYKLVADEASALFTPLMESAIPISLNTSLGGGGSSGGAASFFIWRCNWWGKMLLVFERRSQKCPN